MSSAAPRHLRILPMVVAAPLGLQNLDTTVMTTALPSIARSLNTEVLRLNLAITAYLLSLAVFLPLSGWLADRWGARRVFCGAIAMFSLGSALCGMSNSLGELVAWRVLQGVGGALMLPVGRLILLRHVPAALMVSAMVWFTVPPTVARMLGPLVGGGIVSFTSWRWIFLINIPTGLLAILLAWRLVPADNAEHRHAGRLDGLGFVLLAGGLTGLIGAMETLGKHLVAPAVTWTLGGAGLLALAGYVWHSRRMNLRDGEPLVDLAILRHRTYRSAVLGGMPMRVGIGAMPFLLPLLFQIGFGLSPLQSGWLTMATALGSLGTRPMVAWSIRHLGFRNVLIAGSLASAGCYASYASFGPGTPQPLVFAALFIGGLCTSMVMVSLLSVGYSEIEPRRVSHASTLMSMNQQVAFALGVVLGSAVLMLSSLWHGREDTDFRATDFMPAFIGLALLALLPLGMFRRLDESAGAHLRA